MSSSISRLSPQPTAGTHSCKKIGDRTIQVLQNNGEWYVIGTGSGGRKNVLRDARFCPFCGINLADDLEDLGEGKQ